jgi:hypothetical protein
MRCILITLGASIRHEIESLDESVLLLTISWRDKQLLLVMRTEAMALRLHCSASFAINEPKRTGSRRLRKDIDKSFAG